MMAYRHWTEKERQAAITLRAKGLSHVKIGEALGRRPSSVTQQLQQIDGAFHKLGKKCLDCSKGLRDTNRCGRCKRCELRRANADPEYQARRLEAVRNCEQLKAGSELRRQAAIKAARTRLTNPEYRAWLVEQMRTVVAPRSQTPEAQAKCDRKAAGAKISEHYMSWCPMEYRDTYREIKRKNALNKDEARAIIFDLIHTDRERAKRKARQSNLSLFERQERALANGAGLAANDPIKSTMDRPVDYGERKWVA
jgi:hypothetical protein